MNSTSLDIPHEEIARRYGTPVYVYDLRQIRAAHAALTDILPTGSRLYYSLKANPHPDLIRCLVELGCDVEVSSQGEIDNALAGGAHPEQMLFTGPGKTSVAVDHALSIGVRRFSVESAADLTRVASQSLAHGTESECLLRINRDTPIAGSSLTMTGVSTQFGIDASALLQRPDLFASLPGAHVTGYHLYSGSNIAPEERLSEQLLSNAQLARQLAQETGLELGEVDLGGGFPARYAGNGDALNPSVLEGLDAHLAQIWSSTSTPPLISFESGRFLVSASGSLLCRAVESKVSKGRSYLILESGINHLGGMSGLRRLPRVQPHLEVLGEEYGTIPGSIVGPLCTPVDFLANETKVPLVPDDTLVRIPDVGAYGLTASLIGFLGHPCPTEVVVDGEQVISASRITLTRQPAAEPDRRLNLQGARP